jgi:hypothetical protein
MIINIQFGLDDDITQFMYCWQTIIRWYRTNIAFLCLELCHMKEEKVKLPAFYTYLASRLLHQTACKKLIVLH